MRLAHELPELNLISVTIVSRRMRWAAACLSPGPGQQWICPGAPYSPPVDVSSSVSEGTQRTTGAINAEARAFDDGRNEFHPVVNYSCAPGPEQPLGPSDKGPSLEGVVTLGSLCLVSQ
ncbi:unnamed protein product [Boreogadus saida]